jgi:transposase InsO family protein
MLERLQLLAQRVQLGALSMEDAAAQVIDDDGNMMPMSRRTLVRYWMANDIEVNVPVGRKQKPVPDDVREKVLEIWNEGHQGICAMAELMKKPEFSMLPRVSKRTITKIFEGAGIVQYRRERPEKQYRCKYVAEQVDLIWHTDIHFYGEGNAPLIAFMDDASRQIVKWSWLDDKRSETTKNFLVEALTDTGRIPYTVWSDNGGEFEGRFNAELLQRGINHNRTKPYNPQQNGKIERFWPTADKARSKEDMTRLMEWYNMTPKRCLPKIARGTALGFMCPNEAREFLPQWTQELRTWRVDGVRKEFQ